jgi:hypothetical protein
MSEPKIPIVDTKTVIELRGKIGADFLKLPLESRRDLIVPAFRGLLMQFFDNLVAAEKTELPPFMVGAGVEILDFNSVEGQNLKEEAGFND